jgi:hypothetical protein
MYDFMETLDDLNASFEEAHRHREQRHATVKLQSVFRGHLERRRIAELKGEAQQEHAAVVLQSALRGAQQRRRVATLLEEARQHRAVVGLQVGWPLVLRTRSLFSSGNVLTIPFTHP